MEYTAEGNQIFYTSPEMGIKELFLTVHPTDSNRTPEQIAITIAGYAHAVRRMRCR